MPDGSLTKVFEKTPRQAEACDVLNSFDHSLLDGGARSGKTAIIIRNIVIRALKTESRHLATRFRFNHAKVSLWYDTIPKVMHLAFRGVKWKANKSDWFIVIPVANSDPGSGWYSETSGGESQIWLGGVDDKDRVEKILGNEYSTIFANECSQISWDAIVTLWTRLAEASGLNLRFYYDCNPPATKHWTYQFFYKGLLPGTLDKHELDFGVLKMNPKDNRKHLPAAYLRSLDHLPKRQRARYRDGIYLDDIEGALWDEFMISLAKTGPKDDIIKTVIAVDPSVSNNPNSDECGIIPMSLTETKRVRVHDDWSGKMSTQTWAQAVANCYEEFDANYVVAEVNQGGDLVKDAIKNVDPKIKIKTVHASKGKFARAEPVSQLYEEEQQRITHDKHLPELEAEMTEWVPQESKESPNRIDALVWGVTELLLKKRTRVHA